MNPTKQLSDTGRRGLRFVVVAILFSLLVGSSGLERTDAADDWLFTDLRWRVPLTISANGYTRTDKPADVPVDFTAMLTGTGTTNAFDPNSIRVVEVDSLGAVANAAVPFQFDPATDYDPLANARGTLVVLLGGQTNGGNTRSFHIYFDVAGSSFSPPSVTPLITFMDGVTDEGFASYQFTTAGATYFYHKQGGGFSSLLDASGNDWISWNSSPGSAGDFRGIPNLVNPQDGGFFHPGRTTSTSTVLSQGPLKVTIKSVSSNRLWETQWEIYPDYARLTVMKAGSRYWFLYEGTPGGQLQNSDRIVRSNGNETAGLGSWLGDISGEEWVYVQDTSAAQSLYLVHEQDDTIVDSYRQMDSLMTVFGFGRNDASGRFITQVPQHFVIGFAGAADHAGMATAIHNAYKPLAAGLGTVETTEAGPVCNDAALQSYFSLKAAGNVAGITFGDEDVLVYDGATCQWSMAFDGSAAGLPANADVDAFEIADDGALFMSFDQPVLVPGIAGKVDDSDIVRYAGGAFTLWFDGSLNGLTTSDEDIDAMTFDAAGNLVISTFGIAAVPGINKAADEDLLRWADGSWALVFDGSHNAGLGKEDTDGVAWLENGDIALSLVDSFVAGSVVGDGSDIVACTPSSLGALTTACSYSQIWDGSARGLVAADAIAIRPIVVPEQ